MAIYSCNIASVGKSIHQTGEDRHNPHVHIMVRDRDIEDGKRVLRLSDSSRDREKAGLEPKAVEWVRERWETVCNRALERAGHEARIDRRTLEAQGIDRTATIHIGPRAQHIENNVQRPVSRVKKDGRGREIDYPMIDAGRTRLERHAEIIDMNLERDARSPNIMTRTWAKWEKDQRGKDKALERELVVEGRRRTLERRRLIGRYRSRFGELRDQEKAEQKTAAAITREVYTPARARLRDRQQQERRDLAKKESAVFRRIAVMLDFTGTLKKRRDEARKTLSRVHKTERQNFARSYKADRKVQHEAVKADFTAARQDIVQERDQRLAGMKERHKEAENHADNRRQDREADRERDRGQMTDALRAFNKDASIGRTPDRSAANDRGSNQGGRGGPSPS